MKTIEIKTTQNVVLEYELAELRDRALAFIIDFSVSVFGIFIMMWILLTMFAGSEAALTIITFLLISCFVFYSLAFEVLNNGQSLGKMALQIQVIKTTGGQATIADYAARWVFRMIDVYFSLGGIASILVASSSKAQRIGDIVANTAVVKRKPQVDLSLKDLLNIKSQESYKPTFMQARQLDEQDVLLIKNALERARQYNNQAHKEALASLADKIRAAMGVTEVIRPDYTFLQIVLNDYVVLTR